MAVPARAIAPVPIWLLTTLNIVLFFAALAPLLSDKQVFLPGLAVDAKTSVQASAQPELNATVPANAATAAPFLLMLRDETGRNVLSHRKRQDFTFYYTLHVFPSAGRLMWCVLMLMQHVAWIRRSHRTLHVLSGYTIAAISTVLSLTGILFPSKGLSYGHPNIWHIHTWSIGPTDRKITLLAWPSFSLQTHAFGVVFLFLIVQVVRSGLNGRKSADHRIWTTAFTYFGYVVHLQRVWIVLNVLCGVILLFAPPDVKSFLSVPDSEQGIFEGERAAFAWATWGGLWSAILLIWYNVGKPLVQKAKIH